MDDKHIFIGKHATIIRAPNKSLIGLSGKITEETKFSVVINKKRIIKKEVLFFIDGKERLLLSKRVEDRIKSR